MKNKIINQIIHELIPLRTLYKEVDNITNDLLIDNYNSLENFIEKEFKDINYSKNLIELIISLIEQNKLDKEYLNIINKDEYESKIVLNNYKALNIKENSLNNINLNIKTNSLNNITLLDNNYPINFKNNDKSFKELETNEEDEILTLEDNHIELLRKMILEAQLNYLNNANQFIEELEDKNEVEIYQSLLNLNDIRYIQHSISKLSINTQERLLNYIIKLLNENKHNSINIFIEEAIKKNIHKKKY